VANALLFGVFVWIIYLALEPFARRHWPRMLISWSRLLSGRFRDPLVGRDLLVGTAGAAVTDVVRDLIVRFWPGPPPAPFAPHYSASARDAIGLCFALPVSSLVWVMGIVFFLAFARRWLRLEWLAAILVTALFSTNFLGSGPAFLAGGVFSVALLVFIATRFGLLAALVTDALSTALYYFVRTADSSAWYFYTGPIVVAAVLAVAIWGYRMAVPVRAVVLAEA
jgi:serine/threonine-protein kinase